MKTEQRWRLPACPKCGSRRSVPIQYGLPAPKAMRLARMGRIKLAGCLVGEDDPDRACRVCEAEWVSERR